MIRGLCGENSLELRTCKRHPSRNVGDELAAGDMECVLSFTIFCWLILSSSPLSMERSESATFPTTAWQAASSLARSSACWIKASRVPILKSGTAKGRVLPFSGVTVADREDRASSLSLESKIPCGKQTKTYLEEGISSASTGDQLLSG